MRSCKAHGQYDPKRQWGCPECVVLLLNVAKAAYKEVVFTYSHPMAADRGQVWTEYKKTPNLYRAMKSYCEALEVAKKKKSGKKKS